MNAVANLGWDEVRLPHPVFEGDTDLLAERGARRRANRNRGRTSGIVQVKTTGVNQHGATVIEFTRTFMVWKRGHVPAKRLRQLAVASVQARDVGLLS